MIEKIGHIRNPLTVIAMFAGIAEVSGTVVLPLLIEPIQATYVWFLMSFPCMLVLVFFLTLWFKPTTLYAPSDYKTDESFISTHFRKNSYEEFYAAKVSNKDLTHAEVDLELPEEAPQEKSVVSDIPVVDRQVVGETEIIMPEFPTRSRITTYVGVNLNAMNFDGLRRTIASSFANSINATLQENLQSIQLPNVKFDAVVESTGGIRVIGFIDCSLDPVALSYSVEEKLRNVRLFWDTLTEHEKKTKFSSALIFVSQNRNDINRAPEFLRLSHARVKHPFETTVSLCMCKGSDIITYHIS